MRFRELQTRHAELVAAEVSASCNKRFRNKFGMTISKLMTMSKLMSLLFLTSVFFLFASCTSEVTLTLQKDDSLDIRFEGGAGEAFAKMINSAAGMSGADASGASDSSSSEPLIDADAVSFELAKAGFSNVKVEQKKGGAVAISMSDKNLSSYIFTSKILKAEKGRLVPSLSRKSLEDFYAASDEQTRMILDLFLAPVFNNEEMSEEEYLEMVGAFYGDAASKEVGLSFVKINLISKDGTKETLNIPFTQLFCGNFNH